MTTKMPILRMMGLLKVKKGSDGVIRAGAEGITGVIKGVAAASPLSTGVAGVGVGDGRGGNGADACSEVRMRSKRPQYRWTSGKFGGRNHSPA